LEKSKFFNKNSVANSTFKSSKQSYIQASKDNIKNIVKIKKNFLKLSVQKVAEIYKVLNNMKKKRPKFNIMIKRISKKQVIIINSNNIERIIIKSNAHIFNINRLLKGVKSNVLADFICSNNKDIIIMTNKIAAFLNFNIRITNKKLHFYFLFYFYG